MKLKVTQILQDDARRKAEVKPLPVLKMKVKSSSRQQAEEIPAQKDPSPKDILLKQLWDDMGIIKKERDKLSTRTAYLVDQLEAKLREENPLMATEFLEGRLPMSELQEHYSKLQQFTEQAKAIYDKIKYVEEHGELPGDHQVVENNSIPPILSASAKEIQHDIRRLDDLICKTDKKIRDSQAGLKKPKNTDRINEWKAKVSMAIIQRDDLKVRLKQLTP